MMPEGDRRNRRAALQESGKRDQANDHIGVRRQPVPEERKLVGIFADFDAMEQAVDELQRSGFARYSLSVGSPPAHRWHDLHRRQIENGGLLLWVTIPSTEREKVAMDIMQRYAAHHVHSRDLP
jgi:hypothetical protein